MVKSLHPFLVIKNYQKLQNIWKNEWNQLNLKLKTIIEKDFGEKDFGEKDFGEKDFGEKDLWFGKKEQLKKFF